MKKISIIIPSYNSRLTIQACVQAALASPYRPLEVIVVDDVSTDDSPEIVEQLVQENPDLVKLVRLDVNGGPARARNAGARIASGDYYFFIDSDTTLLPDAISTFIKRIEDPEIGADSVSGLYHWHPLNRGACPAYKALLNYYLFSRQGLFEYEVFNGAVGGLKAEVFKLSGGFNEDLAWGMDYENEEFGHRLIKNHKLVLDPGIAVNHAFPGFKKMTRDYFMRVSLWMELFMRRRKFESGGPAAAGTGISTIAAPAFLTTMPLVAFGPYASAVPLLFFIIYIYGYAGFLTFVLKNKPSFLAQAFVLNLYFCSVIGLGATYGALRVLTGHARVDKDSVIQAN